MTTSLSAAGLVTSVCDPVAQTRRVPSDFYVGVRSIENVGRPVGTRSACDIRERRGCSESTGEMRAE